MVSSQLAPILSEEQLSRIGIRTMGQRVRMMNAAQAMHYRLRGSIGKKKFFLDWPAFTHFWSNFDEIFCAGVKP